jgi:hypothetical protein
MIYHGYAVLEGRGIPYKGVDSAIVAPELVEGELDPNPKARDTISSFYPQGWRRSVYELFEQNPVRGADFLISTLSAAREIVSLMPRGSNPYLVLECHLATLNHAPTLVATFGFDIAFFYGDFYSAIYNGLHCNPAPELIERWPVNVNGLFASCKNASVFVEEFKRCATTEKDSTFWIYALSTP